MQHKILKQVLHLCNICYKNIARLLLLAFSLDGVKTKGESAHQDIITYVCDKYKFNTVTKLFIQEMRDYRNKISYEGFSIKVNYIKTNSKRIEEIITSLQKLVGERLA